MKSLCLYLSVYMVVGIVGPAGSVVLSQASGQQDERAENADAHSLVIYRLEHISPVYVVSTLSQILGVDAGRITGDSRTGSVIVLASKVTHERIRALLEALDQPAKIPKHQVKLFPFSGDPRAIVNVLGDVLPEVHLTVDSNRSLLIFSAPSSDQIQFAQALTERIVEGQHSSDQGASQSGPYMLRFVWLETGIDSPPSPLMTNDLIDAVAPLESVGVSGLHVAAQGILRIGKEQKEAEAEFAGIDDRRFSILCGILPGDFNLQLTADAGTDSATEMTARASLQPGQWVILGAMGSPEHQKVFAVQRMPE